MRLLVVSEGVHELAGALTRIVERLLPAPAACAVEPVKSRRVKRHLRPGRHERYEKRFIGWLAYAEAHAYDAVIIVVDEDGDATRSVGATKAQNRLDIEIPRAIGVAIRAFDAWMIADEKAWSKALDRTVDRPPDPEGIRQPKEHARILQASAGRSVGLRELYETIASNADLAVIEERCPRGFAPFADRVRALVA